MFEDRLTRLDNAGLLAAEAEAPAQPLRKAESYGRLVWRRFCRSKTGLVGGVLVGFLLLVTVFANFFAPYDPARRDSQNIYVAPQAMRFWDENGPRLLPYTHPLEVTFDPITFQTTTAPDTSRKCELAVFGEGWEYKLFGLTLSRHFLAPDPDCPFHVLGTDGLGRDMLSRILVGSQLTLLMAGLVVAISVTVGTLLGVFSGYHGGAVDNAIQRGVELVLAIPQLPFYLALVAIIPRNTDPLTVFLMLAAILSALKWAQLAREVRGKTLGIRQSDFVRAAEAIGASDRRIVLRHLLPNVMSHVVVITTLMIPQVVLIESFLSFLGIGVQPPLVSWGLLLNAGKDLQNLGSYPWVLTPVVAILMAVLGFNMLGDGLRDAVDPYAQ